MLSSPHPMRRITASVLSAAISLSIATPAFATSYNTQCIQTAVEKREGTFITAFDAYYASTRTALISRKDSLKTAWTITDSKQRRDTIRNAEKNFATSEKSARKTRRDAEKAAAKTFKNEAELCEIQS